VVKQAYLGQHPMTRAPGTVENLFSDYRLEQSLLLPHRQVRRLDGQEVMTVTVNAFEANPAMIRDFQATPNRRTRRSKTLTLKCG